MTGGPDHSELGRALNSMGVQPPTEPESLCIQQLGKLDGKNTLAVYGSDERGLAYALLEVASTVGLAGPQGDPLANVSNALERPTLGVRGAIKYFVSEIVDKEWFYSTEYWEDYLPCSWLTAITGLPSAWGQAAPPFSTLRTPTSGSPTPFSQRFPATTSESAA